MPEWVSRYDTAPGASMSPKPWANGSADGTGLQVDSSARRSAGGEGRSSRASADSTQAATPQAFGDDMEVP